jgi:hypothetical protein
MDARVSIFSLFVDFIDLGTGVAWLNLDLLSRKCPPQFVNMTLNSSFLPLTTTLQSLDGME